MLVELLLGEGRGSGRRKGGQHGRRRRSQIRRRFVRHFDRVHVVGTAAAPGEDERRGHGTFQLGHRQRLQIARRKGLELGGRGGGGHAGRRRERRDFQTVITVLLGTDVCESEQRGKGGESEER